VNNHRSFKNFQESVKVRSRATDGQGVTRTTRLVLATATALLIALPMGGAVAQAAPAPTPATAATTVTVQAGDTLSGIAARFGVRLSALLRANSMTVTSLIRPGDTLVVPAGSTAPTPTPASSPTTGRAVVASAPATTTTTTITTTYVVKPGDALARIARLNGVKLGPLLKANNLKATSLIVPGQILKVPPATMPIPAPRVTTPNTTSTTPAPAQTIANAGTTPAPTAVTPGGSLGTVLTFLRAQVGVPYAFFRAGPDAYDCSGLVVAGFRQVGVNLPHQSRALAKLGAAVDWTSAPIAAGDLVFTSVVGDPNLISHVGVALDAKTWIHAVGVGRSVSIGSLPPASKIMAVRRIALP
jgi:peptidoglycan endopeptidase LytE